MLQSSEGSQTRVTTLVLRPSTPNNSRPQVKFFIKRTRMNLIQPLLQPTPRVLTLFGRHSLYVQTTVATIATSSQGSQNEGGDPRSTYNPRSTENNGRTIDLWQGQHRGSQNEGGDPHLMTLAALQSQIKFQQGSSNKCPSRPSYRDRYLKMPSTRIVAQNEGYSQLLLMLESNLFLYPINLFTTWDCGQAIPT